MPIGLQVKRGLQANMPVLAVGEFGYATDSKQLFIGSSAGNLAVGPFAVNFVQTVVNFGISPTVSEDTTARMTASASWVTASSILVCTVAEGQDHTDDEIAAEQVSATVGNIQPGVRFDVVLSAPNGASGKFLVNIEG